MQDPASDLISFLTKGENLPAIGATLVLIVGFVRNVLLAKVPWFQTKLGGYALGWGFTTIVYVGTSLEQHVALTLRLLELALASGLLASGVLDHFRDIVALLTSPPKTAAFDPKTGQTDMQKAAGMQRARIWVGFPRPRYLRLVSTAAMFGVVTYLASCATVKAVPHTVKVAVVECAKQDAKPILAVVADLAVQATVSVLKLGHIDWDAIEKKAYEQGEVTGGCALTRFVAELEKAPQPEAAVRSLVAGPDLVADGRAAVERLSTRFGGTTWVQ